MTEYQILQVLKRKYPSDAYAVIPQVRNATGFGTRTRTADAIAVSLWPSRGIGIEGFEFKDSRTDWLKELADPAKAEEISRYCERWWIVTSSPGIVHDGELPKTWGLMEIVDGAIKVKVKAPVDKEPQKPGWPFIASLLRSASQSIVPESDVQREVEKARAEERGKVDQLIESAVDRHVKETRAELDKLRKVIRDFERASGFRFDHYRPNGYKIGALAKLLAADYGGVVEALTGARNTMASYVTGIDAALGSLPKIADQPTEPAA